MRGASPKISSSIEEKLEWLALYLSPIALEGGGFRAHQFTINGLTRPFVTEFGFAGVPEPLRKRRYDMLSGLLSVRPGDVLFFFQADPTAPSSGIDGRRGIWGVYRAGGVPYRGTSSFRTTSGTGYRVLASCQSCGSSFGTMSPVCPECEQPRPTTTIAGLKEPQPEPVLSARLPVEPIYHFARSVSDERAYADFSDSDFIWVGRHDNAMGLGKGSSIRHLLPEEAVRLLRLLLTEPEQSVVTSTPINGQEQQSLFYHSSDCCLDANFLPIDRAGKVESEDELYYAITRQLEDPQSALWHKLDQHLPSGLSLSHLEYSSGTFPWGYTGGAADYVLFFRDTAGRREIVIFECKKDSAHDEAVLQSLLYCERVLQARFRILTQLYLSCLWLSRPRLKNRETAMCESPFLSPIAFHAAILVAT